MSQQARDLLCLPFIATAAVSAYRCVDFSGVQITAAGAKIAGISKRPAAIGDPFEAAAIGTAVAEAGAAISVGQSLVTDTSGRLVPASNMAIAIGTLQVAAGATAVTSTAANGAILTGTPTLSGGEPPQIIVARALQSASAAGQFIEVLLCI